MIAVLSPVGEADSGVVIESGMSDEKSWRVIMVGLPCGPGSCSDAGTHDGGEWILIGGADFLTYNNIYFYMGTVSSALQTFCILF